MAPGTDVATRTPAQQLVAAVRDERVKEQLQMALPPTVTVDKFVRVMSAAIMTNPDIATLDHNSILTAMVKSAALGLIPDGVEAAIVGRKNKATFVPMIGGYRKIAAEHGWQLRTAVVYANDEFDHAVIDGEETITHRPVRPGAERGELIAAYAIARHRDGRRVIGVLHPDDIAKRRSSASTQNVWDAHPAAMWEKSAGKDVFAQLGLSDTDLVQQVLRADEIDPAEARDAMYGSEGPSPQGPATGPASLPPAEQGGGRQQADDAEPQRDETAAAEEASSAPGDEEPDLDQEPGLNDDEQAAIQAAANDAAILQLPSGKHEGKTLGEIAQLDGSDNWFVYALRNPQGKVPALVEQAVWAFTRVYKPELYSQVLGEKEAQAAA